MKFSIKVKMALLMLIVVVSICIVGVLAINQMNELKDASLKTQENQIRDEFDKNIKEQVQNALSLLDTIYKNAQSGEYSMEVAKKMGADLLRELRYGVDGYFWADTYNGDNVVLLGKDTEGKNRIDAQDVNGFKMIQAIIKVGKEPEGGYTNYSFPKANETEPLPKRSYSKSFEPFQWVIGTGNYTDFIDEYIIEQEKIAEESISLSIRKMVVLVGVCLLFSILISLYIVFSIIISLKKFIKITDHLAKGNLDTEININSKDEIGELATSMRALVSKLKTYIVYINEISDLLKEMGTGNLDLIFQQTYDGDFEIIKDSFSNTANLLNEILSEFSSAANQVAIGSDQIASSAQSLSQGATEQASSIEELSASLMQVSSQIIENAENVSIATKYIEEAAFEAKQSNEQMKNMLSAMDDINNSSNEISKIIKVIDDIAFQTNILALNAAVEAARAGAAGKGFAIVADEVRNLASKSANAAKQTAVLIENSIEMVSNGSKIAEKTALSLEDVETKAKLLAETMEKIAEASKQQATAIEQINIGVEQISTVVQTNSATAEESAASSEELSGQANVLKNQISIFNLKENIDIDI